MNILVTTAITSTGTANQILKYCTSTKANIAVGGGLPWSYPDIPLKPDLNVITLPDVIGYFPASKFVPVIKSSDGGIITSAEPQEIWKEIPLTLESLSTFNCKHVYIEAVVNHNLLPQSTQSYKSAGLYLDSTNTFKDYEFYVGLPLGYLDLVQHYGVLPKVENAKHTVQIIREF